MKKFRLDIQETIAQLIAQEDTDNDKRITIDDHGLKKFELKNIYSVLQKLNRLNH